MANKGNEGGSRGAVIAGVFGPAGALVAAGAAVAAVHRPPGAGGRYWLMALVPTDPRPIHVARDSLGQGQTSIPVEVRSGIGTTRTFYIGRNHDGDASWDGQRTTLPAGAAEVSNRCQAPRQR